MMNFISKLEKVVLGWAKNVPHLPVSGQKWLATNAWWIVLVGAIITGITVLISLAAFFALISLVGAPSSSYFVTSSYLGFAIVYAAVNLVLSAVNVVLLGLAVKPLQNMQKKGWVLLFITLLVQAIAIILHAVLTLNVAGFIVDLLFGAIGLAIGAYFLAEIHNQFAHTPKVRIRKV